MRVFQAKDASGAVRPGLLEGSQALILAKAHGGVSDALDLLLAAHAKVDLLAWRASAVAAQAFFELPWSELVAGRPDWRLVAPLTPPEVWAAGVTYKRSADFREEGTGFYDKVYAAERPELFFKTTAWRCSGSGEPIGRRHDSTFTASEPELAVVVTATGSVLGYTLANDVSAWDIERENPLYLPQSKIYRGCFSFGPVIVTADEIKDPHALELTCVVRRGDREVFAGKASTNQLKRRIPELIDWLLRSNEIHTGTILSTGTGIIQPLGSGLEEHDVVTISCPEIGELRNPVVLV